MGIFYRWELAANLNPSRILRPEFWPRPFANVKVWVDANHDAVTDAGELKTLAELNISQINLNAQAQSGLVRDGNEVLATGSFVQAGVTKEARLRPTQHATGTPLDRNTGSSA